MNIAVLGTWHVHAPEYTEAIVKNPHAQLVAVWDKDPQKGASFAEKYQTSFVADLDTLLASPEIDSVCICTATNEHPEVITKAANSGKHIFTEKVLGFTKQDAMNMKQAIDAAGIQFTISFPHRTFGKLLFAKQMVESEALGTITYARVRNVHNGASAGWLPPHFYDQTQCGGGAMMDLGAHPMYTLGWLLGAPASISSTFTSVTDKPVEDNAVSVLQFATGAIAVSETGFVSENNPYTLELSGTKGALMVHGDSVTYCCEETGNEWKPAVLPANQPLPIDQWMDAVEHGTAAPFGTDDAVLLSELMEGAYIAMKTQATYRFN